MIFSRFIKAKWQHKSSVVRIQAINDELDPEQAEHREILLTLLHNDVDSLVRKSVLIRLASFEQWLAASQNKQDPKLRTFANEQLMKMLQEQHASMVLTLAQKLSLLAQTNNPHTLETWLAFETNSQLIIAIFEKLHKPQLLISLFNQKQQIDVQEYLLAQVEEPSILTKLLKKTVLPQITQAIQAKLTKQQELAERPIQLRKQVQLVLAKLLALRDQSDYQLVLEKQQQLNKEWLDKLSNFSVFDQQEQNQLIEKHDEILIQLEKIFAGKAEQFQQQQIAEKLEQQRDSIRIKVKQTLRDIQQQITASVFEHNTIDEALFDDQLSMLATLINDSLLINEEQQQWQQQLHKQRQQLSRLPDIAQAVAEATQLISKISQWSLPTTVEQLTEKQTQFEQWCADWQQVSTLADGILPVSITDAQQQIVQHWRQGLKPFQQQQGAVYKKVQKQIHDVQRLLKSGKFNACFAIYKKITQQLSLLAEYQQANLQRDIEQIDHRLNELSDWEHYVATPKKQHLLVEIQALVDAPLDNPLAQAEQIKQARKQWNLSGHAEDDEQLNQQFNELSELAFAPCRQFYAEQEKIRTQNLSTRQTLIQQAQQLSEHFQEQTDWKKLDAALNKLNQQWQQAGEVDRAQYKKVHKQFTSALAPVKQALLEYQQSNAQAKHSLIEQAQQCLTLATHDAIEQIKQLQTQWKAIGYAGPRIENKLWQTFRAVNDQFFAQREQEKQQTQSALQSLAEQWQQQLNQLQQSLLKVDNKTELVELQQGVEQLLSSIDRQSEFKKLVKVGQHLKAQITEKYAAFSAQDKQRQWLLLFALIEQYIHQQNGDIDTAELSTYWQKKIAEAVKSKQSVDRQSATLELEILAGLESPIDLQQQRMHIQVALMQEQMTSGVAVDLEQKFADWLIAGQLTLADLPLLERIKPIFCH